MKAFTERRSLRMGCGEPLRHRAVRMFRLDEHRAETTTDVGDGRVRWSNAPEAPAPGSPDSGKRE
jgi:hypothetical protein